MIVTIDGPAGVGKGTVARALADRLSFVFLDTGALYRMITLAGVEAGIDPKDPDQRAGLLARTQIDLVAGKAVLNGRDVSETIRDPALTARIGRYAGLTDVRTFVTARTRELANQHDVISEGRDQGTVVFPDAECKFFLTAREEVRARRRYEELKEKGVHIRYEEVLAAQQERDAEDRSRPVGGLACPRDAVLVDSSDMTASEVVERMFALVRMRMDGAHDPAAVRQAVFDLAQKSLSQGDPVGWFEQLYSHAEGDPRKIPWADRRPNPHLVEWLDRHPIDASSPRALVVGCGLGDDANSLAAAGMQVVGFDLSPTAIAWAGERFPHPNIQFEVANLLESPDAFRSAFDFVFEAYTWQALPVEVRPQAIRAVAGFLKPGGKLLIVARGREPDDPNNGPPWPLTRDELDLLLQSGLREVTFEDYLDEESPPVRRFRVLYERPADSTGPGMVT